MKLPEMLLLFLLSLHNPREGLKPLQPENLLPVFFFFPIIVMSGLEGSHANELQVPQFCHLAPCPAGRHRHIWKVQQAAGSGRWRCNPVPATPLSAPWLTLAFKLLGRRGEEQLALHVWGPSATGNAWFLVAGLHPAGQPAEVAVAVQGVGTNGPVAESGEKRAFQPQGSWGAQGAGRYIGGWQQP